MDALRERTHVRENPNPGSRRARLAGSVHRDDRRLDPGAGKFVTDFLKLKHDGYRLSLSCLQVPIPDHVASDTSASFDENK